MRGFAIAALCRIKRGSDTFINVVRRACQKDLSEDAFGIDASRHRQTAHNIKKRYRRFGVAEPSATFKIFKRIFIHRREARR